MKEYKNADWVSPEGEVSAISPTQHELISSEIAKSSYMQFNFFRRMGLSHKADELREKMNEAMQLAYERDVGVSGVPAISTQGPKLV